MCVWDWIQTRKLKKKIQEQRRKVVCRGKQAGVATLYVMLNKSLHLLELEMLPVNWSWEFQGVWLKNIRLYLCCCMFTWDRTNWIHLCFCHRNASFQIWTVYFWKERAFGIKFKILAKITMNNDTDYFARQNETAGS